MIGRSLISVSVQTEDFDLAAQIEPLAKLGGGAVSNFIGYVRGEGGLIALELEHYPMMTEKALTRLAEEAADRWSLLGVSLVHRVGRLDIAAQIVLVATASRHRRDALDACAFLIDRLKTDAPFWKKEIFSDGDDKWIEQREADLAAKDIWD